MEPKKVLIITYYWPPSGGSGVQRWLKFVKYLPQNGVQPHIYTPENPDFNVKDESFLKDIPKEAIVVKRKIIEPYGIHRFLVGKKKAKGANFGNTNSSKTSTVQKLSLWVRSNIFLPDPRVLWVKPSIKYLKKYIIDNNIETIITTGPPHSMHLIGLGLKSHFKDSIQWITDFRDPWTKIFNKDELRIGKRARKKLIKLENRVIKSCDKLITVSEFLKSEFEEMGGEGKSYAICNGFDHTDYNFSEIKKEKKYENKFVVSYIGLLPKISNPLNLWEVLGELIKSNEELKKDLKLVFVGSMDSSIVEILDKRGLIEYCEFAGVVPHNEAVKYQKFSDLLLLLIPNVVNSKGILTGKFFEYMASETPILAIGDVDGDVAKILEETETGMMVSFEEKKRLKVHLEEQHKKFKSKKNRISIKKYQKYSRKELTKKLAKIFS